MDKILVIIPVYNKEEFLEGAIESILQQTHKNIELVIIDDCSTDKSLEIAKLYEHLDNVTVLQNSENRGCYYTRNKGLEYFKDKKWDYFTIHDADDVSDVRRFKVLLEYFDAEPNILGLKTTYVRVNKDLTRHIRKDGSLDIYSGEGIALFPRKAFELMGYYDNSRTGADTDYWTRIRVYCEEISSSFKIKSCTKILYYARLYGDNLTLKVPVSTRGNYYQKITKDIKGMIQTGNFYRDIFE